MDYHIIFLDTTLCNKEVLIQQEPRDAMERFVLQSYLNEHYLNLILVHSILSHFIYQSVQLPNGAKLLLLMKNNLATNIQINTKDERYLLHNNYNYIFLCTFLKSIHYVLF